MTFRNAKQVGWKKQWEVIIRDYQTYSDFWPYYLQEHAKPSTRLTHYVGTALVLLILARALLLQEWMWLFAVPLAGYGFAWFSHAFMERNKPATFTYPLWSLISDFRMFFLWVTGRLGPHLQRAGGADVLMKSVKLEGFVSVVQEHWGEPITPDTWIYADMGISGDDWDLGLVPALMSKLPILGSEWEGLADFLPAEQFWSIVLAKQNCPDLKLKELYAFLVFEGDYSPNRHQHIGYGG